MIERPDSDAPATRAGWDRAYLEDDAPWDIGRPQPAFVALAEAGEIRSPVLDSGCGTGEQALMLAERGLDAVGVDIAPAAISRARDGSICPPELANRCQLKFQERVATSADGLTWTDLAAPLERAQGEAFIEALASPTTAGSPWIMFVSEYGQDSSFQGGTLWLSEDLDRWAAVSPPKASTFPLASTSEGLIASSCNRRGQKCALFLTSDGREWTAIAGGHESAAFGWVAEGPAGVIAGTEASAVYRLEP